MAPHALQQKAGYCHFRFSEGRKLDVPKVYFRVKEFDAVEAALRSPADLPHQTRIGFFASRKTASGQLVLRRQQALREDLRTMPADYRRPRMLDKPDPVASLPET